MLASVYSYPVMVKSVSSCCVRGRRVLSNPVTYMHMPYSYAYNMHMVKNKIKRLYTIVANVTFPYKVFYLVTNNMQ